MDKVSQAISLLTELGWLHIGSQPVQTFRTFSGGSSVPNATITTGGRQRLEKPGTQRRATVGKRSVCFFVYDGHECKEFQTVKTGDFNAIKILGA